mmetsp:Transcript_7784/g.17316  ORF Transcript_7784/g.17316 Transcript_7784/m.17316 type:complete len:88 (+) Transcript_7784:1682-1945(+)|eukprot:scaffold3240_cov197-Alexandrium_tamarense.AAC.3
MIKKRSLSFHSSVRNSVVICPMMLGRDDLLGESTRLIARDANDFNDEDERQHNVNWKKVAVRMDVCARFFVPLAFASAVSLVVGEAL